MLSSSPQLTPSIFQHPALGPIVSTCFFFAYEISEGQRLATKLIWNGSAMRRSGFVANNSHQGFCTSCGRFSAGALRSKPDEDHGAGVCKGSSFAIAVVFFLALPPILTVGVCLLIWTVCQSFMATLPSNYDSFDPIASVAFGKVRSIGNQTVMLSEGTAWLKYSKLVTWETKFPGAEQDWTR